MKTVGKPLVVTGALRSLSYHSSPGHSVRRCASRSTRRRAFRPMLPTGSRRISTPWRSRLSDRWAWIRLRRARATLLPVAGSRSRRAAARTCGYGGRPRHRRADRDGCRSCRRPEVLRKDVARGAPPPMPGRVLTSANMKRVPHTRCTARDAWSRCRRARSSTRRRDVDTDVVTPRCAWRGAGANNGVAVAEQLERNQPRLFLENQRVPPASHATRRQTRSTLGCPANGISNFG